MEKIKQGKIYSMNGKDILCTGKLSYKEGYQSFIHPIFLGKKIEAIVIEEIPEKMLKVDKKTIEIIPDEKARIYTTLVGPVKENNQYGYLKRKFRMSRFKIKLKGLIPFLYD